MRTLQIDDDTYMWLKAQIASMKAMYADQNRDDWWDADDIAREVAETVGELIKQQEG